MSMDSAERQLQLRFGLSRQSAIFTHQSLLCWKENLSLGWRGGGAKKKKRKETHQFINLWNYCNCLLYIISIKLNSLGKTWQFVCCGIKHSRSSCWINMRGLSRPYILAADPPRNPAYHEHSSVCRRWPLDPPALEICPLINSPLLKSCNYFQVKH